MICKPALRTDGQTSGVYICIENIIVYLKYLYCQCTVKFSFNYSRQMLFKLIFHLICSVAIYKQASFSIFFSPLILNLSQKCVLIQSLMQRPF